MKAYTDLEQSQKLAKILPRESADVHYERVYFEGKQSNWFVKLGLPIKSDDIIPCWSLAALLDVIPKRIKDYNVLRIDINDNDFAIWYDEIGYGVNNDLPNITTKSAVDACYEMILKLHELKML